MPRRARHVLLLSLIAVLALPAAGASAAGVITRENPGDQIDYEAVGAANVVITDAPQGAGTLVTVAEAGISLAVGTDECTDLGNLVTCAFAYPEEGRIDLAGSALGDTFDGRALTRTVMSAMGNDGNDVIRGGNTVADPEGNDLGDSLNGGEDIDQIFGGDGNDFLTALRDGGELGEGGPGDDNFISLGGGATGDTLRGGPGFDQIWMRASPGIQSFTIDLTAQTITDQAGLDGPDVIEGFEDARTDEGNDILLGTAGFNILRSGGGNDRLDGRLGADVAFGEAGADRLEARDGVADRLTGGADADTCITDQLDETSDCESVQSLTVTPLGAVFPDVDPPGCTTPGLAARPRARRLARRALSVQVDCDEPGRVTIRLLAKLTRLDGRARLAGRGDLELARASATLGAGDEAALRLRVGRRLRGLLRRGARLRVELKAVDSAGNRARPVLQRMRLR